MKNNETHLDYASAFDEALCRSLLAAVMAAFSAAPDAADGNHGQDPVRTFRQVARMVAVEAGFDARCVARACKCSTAAVRAARDAILRRVERQNRGIGKGKVRDNSPLSPVLVKARAAAAAWRLGGSL